MRAFLGVALGLIACAMAGGVHAQETYVRYVGTATARHTARFMYGEDHILKYQEGALVGRVVLYRCADGTPFARKTVLYGDSWSPDFAFEDVSNGMREGVHSEGATRTMWFRANRVEPERTALVPQGPVVIDAGFDEFVLANWDRLLAGPALPLAFLVPSRMTRMSFDVGHLERRLIDDQPAEVFRMKLNGMLGWLLPGIDVAYDAHEHSLLSYEGLSNLRDRAGDNYQVSIRFPRAARAASSAKEDAAARAATLGTCAAPP